MPRHLYGAPTRRLGILFTALVVGALVGAPARPAAAAQTLRVLLVAVDGNQAQPRSLRHHENNQVTNTSWSSAATLEHFAFDRSTSFAALFDEMSYGELDLVGDATVVSIPADANQYTWQQWADLADAEATAQGFDLSTYDRFLYLLPFLPLNAPATGTAVGARGMCAQPTYIDLSCVFHELGHTLGLRHGSELQPNGSVQGQGDVSDGLMGLGFSCHVNAVNKYRAGWLVGNRLHEVTTAGYSSHVLAPQSSQANALQVVRIKMGDLYTYVSYRDTNGFDQELIGGLLDVHGDDVANSVVIHRHLENGGGDAVYVESLQPGESHVGWGGVTVSVLGIGGGQASISVSRGSWLPAPPQLSLSPTNATAQPWLPGNYTLSVTNPNPAGTPFDAHYEIDFFGASPGWEIGFTTFSGQGLEPGETRQHPFWVAPAAGTGLGVSPFLIQVSDPDADVPTTTAAFGTFTAVGPLDTIPPSPPVGATIYPSPGSTFVTWNASVDDLSGVDYYEVVATDGMGGAAEFVGTSAWIGIVDPHWQPLARYSVRAVDKAGNASGWSLFFAEGESRQSCGLGFELVGLLPPLLWWRGRRRRG